MIKVADFGLSVRHLYQELLPTGQKGYRGAGGWYLKVYKMASSLKTDEVGRSIWQPLAVPGLVLCVNKHKSSRGEVANDAICTNETPI